MTFEIIILAFLLILFLASYFDDKYKWNKGVCRKNGLRWKRFDIDSQGGHGYVADKEYCWIAWPIDK